MGHKRVWNNEEEEIFFRKALEVATPEQLFYTSDDGRYLAYWPNNYRGRRTTLQSRNSYIGNYSEKWTKELLEEIAEAAGAYSVSSVVSDEIELSGRSPADVAICKTKEQSQKPETILMIIEVKISVVWNWEFNPSRNELVCIGDYTTHQGTPGLLRSDTMLKAIGKSINIRVASFKASQIPIVVIGNTPITDSYYQKVDNLKKTGVIQGFYSINPNPLDSTTHRDNIKSTNDGGYLRIDTYDELKRELVDMLTKEQEWFSGMRPKKELGKIIELASLESTYEKKAEKFLELIRSRNGEQIQ